MTAKCVCGARLENAQNVGIKEWWEWRNIHWEHTHPTKKD